jgi:signal transduction histidine kinase
LERSGIAGAFVKIYVIFQSTVKGTAACFSKLVLPKTKNEDWARQEFILNIILVVLIIFLIIANLIVANNLLFRQGLFDPEALVPIGSSLIILGFFIFLFLLSKHGQAKIAAYILTTSGFVFTLAMTLAWGIELPPTILFYVLMIVISGILISTRFAFLTAVASALIIFVLNFLQNNGTLQPELDWKTESWDNQNVLALGVIFLIIATVSWLSNREIEKSLGRARRSEAALKDERDNLEIRVIEKTQELQQSQLQEMAQFHRLAEFGRLSSGLFHELANPLTALNLNIEQIKESCRTKDSLKKLNENLDKAIKATKKMGEFINSFRKQTSAKEDRSVFSLNQEIEEVLDILNYKARRKKVGLIFSAENNITIFNNSLKFHQIISNLVSNAIDAYPEEATNGINNRLREVLIDLAEEEKQIILTISDFGQGIPENLQTKIFEPFFSTKKVHDGTGLGLAIAKEMINKDFGGEIKVKSQLGQGTKFILILPKEI